MSKILLCCFVFFICNCALGQEIDQNLHDLCIYPTVKISDFQEKIGGSGFIVRSELVNKRYYNIVLSAAHITDQQNFPWVVVGNYKQSEIINYNKYPMIVYADDIKRDILVGLFISDIKMPTVVLNFNDQLFINTKVFHVGYTLLDDAKIDFGVVTQPKTIKPESFKGMIRTNCYSYLGDSGGPLFLQSNYSVIGICHAIRSFKGTHLTQISYYKPIQDLKDWNKELKNDLDFVFDKNKPLPNLPFLKLKLLEENRSKVIEELKKSE